MTDYKAQAERLANYLSRVHGVKLRRCATLEAVAEMHGVRDWNTLLAQAALNPAPETRCATATGLNQGAHASPAPGTFVTDETLFQMAGWDAAFASVVASGYSEQSALEWLAYAVRRIDGLNVLVGTANTAKIVSRLLVRPKLMAVYINVQADSEIRRTNPVLEVHEMKFSMAMRKSLMCDGDLYVIHSKESFDSADVRELVMAVESGHKLLVCVPTHEEAEALRVAVTANTILRNANWRLPLKPQSD